VTDSIFCLLVHIKIITRC